LWSGWKIFLPGTNTPFVPIDGLAIFYFQVGRLIYFSAPILIGWAIGLVAGRQRLKAGWPAVGWILIAWIGGTAQVRASRTAVRSVGHIRMGFALGPSVHGIPDGLFHALVIFSLTVLPFRLVAFCLSGCFSKPQALEAWIQSLRNILCFAETTG
jgi:hypothetical protein